MGPPPRRSDEGDAISFSVAAQEENAGIIPRAMDDIFNTRSDEDDAEFQVQVSYIEIYLEQVKDLLFVKSESPVSPGRKTGDLKAPVLRIRQDPVHGIFIENATKKVVRSSREVMELIHQGNARKVVKATGMNKQSSRSHSILMIDLVHEQGRLYFVDLAGSEIVNKSFATGKVLKEAQMINKSLSALGQVIQALVHQKSHVPYRDSKLTRILQDVLGGNSKTSLIITASPHSDVSFSKFGHRFITLSSSIIEYVGNIKHTSLWYSSKKNHE